jgi:D-xylose transport system ATP-binding protein
MSIAVPILRARDIVKDFPGVRALDAVSFDAFAGEIHALVGENGAGKSTLIKVLSGVHAADAGAVMLDGDRIRFRSSQDSEAAGIAVIHQELALVPHLSVGENIFLGDEPVRFGLVDWDRMYHDAETVLQRLGVQIDCRERVQNLSVGEQQTVEIAKAMHKRRRILILDEPTSALAQDEFETLAALLDDLRTQGTAIIYISHKLDEVLRIADRLTVLRDGKTVDSRPRDTWNRDQIVRAMVGREIEELYPRIEHVAGEVRFEVNDFCVPDPLRPGRNVVDHISFQVRAGEVLGLAGLVGAGRSELLLALFGYRAGYGRVRIDGQDLRLRSPRDAIDAGLALVPEDRNQLGLIPSFPVGQNLSLAHLKQFARFGFLNDQQETQRCAAVAEEFRVKTAGLDVAIETLSGGNQQKVVLGKWMLVTPKVLFLDEPTRGIDVGAKAEIYSLIDDLTRRGLAVVVVSSELPEVLGISDRVIVLREGRQTGSFSREDATPEGVMAVATT